MRRFISALIISGLCVAPVVFAQDSGTKTEAKKAGAKAEQAAKDTGSAAKHVGKATVNGTKKVAAKVTGQKAVACVDGTTQTGKTRAAACADHGGVKVTAKAKS